MLSVKCSSPLWTALKLCWGTPMSRKIYVISCLLHVMATTQSISSRSIVDKWLVSGNGGSHFSRHKKKIPGQIVDITNILLLEELWTVDYYICVKALINKTTNTIIVFITQIYDQMFSIDSSTVLFWLVK